MSNPAFYDYYWSLCRKFSQHVFRLIGKFYRDDIRAAVLLPI
jgi:hypothetical protein